MSISPSAGCVVSLRLNFFIRQVRIIIASSFLEGQNDARYVKHLAWQLLIVVVTAYIIKADSRRPHLPQFLSHPLCIHIYMYM
jgi:hypothetical protein